MLISLDPRVYEFLVESDFKHMCLLVQWKKVCAFK